MKKTYKITENQPTVNVIQVIYSQLELQVLKVNWEPAKTCSSSYITCTANDQHSSSSCKGTSWLAYHGIKHSNFCCL